MILKRLFRRAPAPARAAYEAIVAAARHPVFYADWHVPDTVDGRFDMITLHTFLLLDRLKGEEASFRQSVVDELFRDMDRSLREMGVGDLSVGKKVRKMAEVFYGRIAAYDRAIAAGPSALESALARNIYPEGAPEGAPARLAAFVEGQRRSLAGLPAEALAAGSLPFKEPEP